MSETVEVAFEWKLIGEVTLDTAGRLLFPQSTSACGVYRFDIDGARPSVYFGEAVDLRRRFSHYRSPGPTQQTNIRLNELLCRVLPLEGRCQVSLAAVSSFRAGSCKADLDLRLKAARVLIESAAIVLARDDGARLVLNLDKAFDRSLGGR